MLNRSVRPVISRLFQHSRRLETSSTFSAYEYPLRTSAPYITKTLSTELQSTATDYVPTKRPNENFDDSQNFSEDKRQEILQSQKKILVTELDSKHKIESSAPTDLQKKLLPIPKKVPEVQLSTLSNGLRIISLENYSQVTALGLICDFGSRYEDDHNTGVNHLMETLAFHSTSSFTSASERIMELGGMCVANSSREQTLYCVDILRNNVEDGMKVLCESVIAPRFEEEEVELGKSIMGMQWDEMSLELKVAEGLMIGGFKGSQLGREYFCPPENIAALNVNSIHSFRSAHLTAPRMVLSATGISHDQLHSLAEKHLSHMPSFDSVHPKISSLYTGGYLNLPSNPEDGLARLALGFEIKKGWNSPDLVTACVLQTLLGGGNSFSAGGPGKGMYSRLYREILIRHFWVESAEAATHFHSESGLFCLHGSCPKYKARDLLKVLADHFIKAAVTLPSEEEVIRAKNMLKCNVLTQLESRLVGMEDLGRQLLTYGKRESQEEMLEKIDSVTAEDIRRVGENIVKGTVTLSVAGDVTDISMDEVKHWFQG